MGVGPSDLYSLLRGDREVPTRTRAPQIIQFSGKTESAQLGNLNGSLDRFFIGVAAAQEGVDFPVSCVIDVDAKPRTR